MKSALPHVSLPAYTEQKIKSPSEQGDPRTILSNSSPVTGTLVKVDHANKWHEFESTFKIPASEYCVIYLDLPRSPHKVISSDKSSKICLAQLRSASKMAPAHKESRFKVNPPSERHKIKSSSSSCPEVSETPVPEVSTPGRA